MIYTFNHGNNSYTYFNELFSTKTGKKNWPYVKQSKKFYTLISSFWENYKKQWPSSFYIIKITMTAKITAG